MKDKILKMVVAFSLYGTFVNAQIPSISINAINNFSSSFKSRDLIYESSLGEFGVGKLSGDSVIITQGFLQSPSKLTSVASEVLKESSFLVYPNPFTDHINLSQNLLFAADLFEIIDLQGRLVLSQSITSTFIDLSLLSSKNYLLKVKSKNAINSIKTIVLIKE